MNRSRREGLDGREHDHLEPADRPQSQFFFAYGQRLAVPDPGYRELSALRIASKGDLVRVVGRSATWTVPDGKTFRYIDVVDFCIVVLKRQDG